MSIENYYTTAPHYAAEEVDSYQEFGLRANAREVLGIISKDIGGLKNKTLLDVGAHTGLFVDEASKNGAEAEGIEINERAVKAAQGRGINVRRASIDEVPRASFDIVCASHVIEHVENPGVFLEGLLRILKPNGLLYIETPDFNSYLARKDKISWKYIALEHLTYLNRESMTLMIQNKGAVAGKCIQRNGELKFLSLSKLAHYLFGDPYARDRLVPKQRLARGHTYICSESLFRGLVRRCFLSAIHILHREDHVGIFIRKAEALPESIFSVDYSSS